MAAPTTVRTYPPGVPSWIDVSAAEPVAAEDFYGRLFGWTFETMTPPGVPRYAVAQLDGRDVAGVGVRQPSRWTTYVATDDIEASVVALTASGGTIVEPIEAGGEGGWSAVFADPAGIELALWQSKRRPGAQAVNVPGAWNFTDLHADDPHAVDFCARLFGWQVDREAYGTAIRVPGYGDHLAATVDPHIHERQASAPPGFADVVGGVSAADAGLPPHWHVTFTVADRDAAAATAERLGATVLTTGEDDWTRKVTVRDPQGAAFTMSQFTPPDGSSFG